MRKMIFSFMLICLSSFQALGQSQGQSTGTANAPPPAFVRVSADGQHFVRGPSDQRFVIWGVNYDHDGPGRLIDEYWTSDWQTVVEDFEEIRDLGANCVRIHLQIGKFMDAPDQVNPQSLQQLSKLIKLAEATDLVLDITGLACYHKKNVPVWFDQLDEQDRWATQARFWEAIAKTCKGSPAVFCYDLMNEPILPGKEPTTEWLTGELGGKFFVQRLALELKDRSRQEIANAWVNLMVDSIRKHDPDHMITVGVIPWVFVFGGGKPLFHGSPVGDRLDFVAVHFYPKKGEIQEALDALSKYDVGKPLLVEEMFPLKCSQSEMKEFIEGSSQFTDGWISFYWGTPAEALRSIPEKTIASQITADWLDEFKKLSEKMTNPGR